MKNKKFISIELVIIIVLSIIVIALMVYVFNIKLTAKQFINFSGIFLPSISPIVVLWIKGSYDKRKIEKKNEEQHLAIFDEIDKTNTSINSIIKSVSGIKNEQDIINEHIKHKSFIKSINFKIEKTISNIIKRELHLDKEIKILFTEIGKGVYEILRDALEEGFENFDIEYIQIKLTAVTKDLENNLTSQSLGVKKDVFKKEIKENVIYPQISKFLKQLNSVILLSTNGKRRKRVEEITILFIENITNHFIEILKTLQTKKNIIYKNE